MPTPRRTWAKTHDSAVESYGEGERAHRTAFAALKHSYEKVGDHWEPKAAKGPSDAAGGAQHRRGQRGRRGPTAGGVDANASKKHLYELAQRLEVPGRSTMTKDELVEALDKANRRETARSRRRGLTAGARPAPAAPAAARVDPPAADPAPEPAPLPLTRHAASPPAADPASPSHASSR